MIISTSTIYLHVKTRSEMHIQIKVYQLRYKLLYHKFILRNRYSLWSWPRDTVTLLYIFSRNSKWGTFKKTFCFKTCTMSHGTKSGRSCRHFKTSIYFSIKNVLTKITVWKGTLSLCKIQRFCLLDERNAVKYFKIWKQNIWLTVYFKGTNSQWIDIVHIKNGLPRLWSWFWHSNFCYSQTY
jgi:hypothetical protein